MYLRPSTNNKPPSTTPLLLDFQPPPRLTLRLRTVWSHGMSCDDLFGSRAPLCVGSWPAHVAPERVVPLEPVARRRAWPAGRDSRSGRPRRGRLGEALARRALRARGRGAPRGAAARRYGGAHERSIRLRSCRRARARARDRPKKTVGRCSRRAREKCAAESRGLFVRARASNAAVLARRDALRRPGHRARGAPAPLVSPRRSRPRSRATHIAPRPRPAAPGSAWVSYTLRTNFLAETRALTPAHPVSMRIGPPHGDGRRRRARPRTS